ncbi:flagellar motor switch protein FliM [Halomonas marinisediminis]|uniref:Flagellar motor switch protein FliM n=1 Tax=Halomonas marinisediminis TaxID=2546095 RepID=A0ABY2D627_9GAMM|nr:flagellar motor switch protein FliM [Halomonas marinisediminis]TDB01932.1 flagellar motor switch protein FliM [Halomonas marinisediminis]
MAEDDLLSQEEIDALLRDVVEQRVSSPVPPRRPRSRIRPYDPATQHRVIRERLHALDIINERFARNFRMSLFNLIRRTADIGVVDSARYLSYGEFSSQVQVPTNINLISMQPLRGTGLIMFPPELVYMVVENMFGGDGRFLSRTDGREFTTTEQRIIQRLLKLAMEAYREAWQAVYPIEVGYLRSEVQVKFASITTSPTEVVVANTFHMEVGNLSSNFQIVMPYSMLEPLHDLLTNPMADSRGESDKSWSQRLARELHRPEVELVADFASLPLRLDEVLSLKVGDVLPLELPDTVMARVDGVPVMECDYGSLDEQRALRVLRLLDHDADGKSEESS